MPEKFKERRHYIRLPSVFPVEFRIRTKGGKLLTSWIQGFTRNVSKGGLCLETKFLKDLDIDLLDEEILVELAIHIPISSSVKATSHAAWKSRESDVPLARDVIGLEFTNIYSRDAKRIVMFARQKKILPPVLLAAGVIFLAFSVTMGLHNYYLRRSTQDILRGYIEKAEELSQSRQKLGKVITELSHLNKQYKNSNASYTDTQDRYQSLKKEYQVLIDEHKKFAGTEEAKEEKEEKLKVKERELALLETELSGMRQENASLKEKIQSLEKARASLSSDIFSVRGDVQNLEDVGADHFYTWLKSHQNQRTGLVLSFEGDLSLRNVGFTYDQALASCAFLLFNDTEAARKILDFYNRRAKRPQGGFVNGYFVDTGDIFEHITHCGPNIWLGIASLQYIKRTGNTEYLLLAERIAKFIMDIQDQDPEGGIRGGPMVTWYATEHNLDAYAFFGMLHEVTGKTVYKKRQARILQWLKKYSYTKWDIPVSRGKGDSTVATDTYAWSIAGVGPEVLQSIGMDPEGIIKFAEEHCKVTALFRRPDGRDIEIEGFDFKPGENEPRGGVVSGEWTAQMIIAYKILSRHFYQKDNLLKASLYLDKALFYTEELKKMVIISPSPTGQGKWCLPYATQTSVDTGHGWRTPVGKDTGSIASTAYTLFCYFDFNPLSFEPACTRQMYEGLTKFRRELALKLR